MLKVNKDRVELIELKDNDGLNVSATIHNSTGFIGIEDHFDCKRIELPFGVLEEIYKWAKELKNE
jgi:hypothetical protein